MTTTTSSSSTTASPYTGTAATAPVTANSASGMSDMFLKLLVAQIQNQNPLEPSDPDQFVTQLSQLSQNEALQKLVSQNSATSNMLYSLQVLAMGNQVGSTVTVNASAVTLGTEAVQGSFTLSGPTSEATLVLTGSDGQAHRVSLGSRAAGAVDFTLDPATLGLPAGTYQIAVQAQGGETPQAQLRGQITRLHFDASGAPLLDVTGVGPVASSDITSFLGHQGSTTR
ncbi:flagellar hook capping FlgD N-terminal domain-containing protein [Paracidovorax anthurii]|uniref:Basal-body rod modification protein FlgD n=1 Tax=Paracidovorax anthurii TaxID=78229 RepID=A0A328YTU4_9BURK|nr:flagellar hook capping FlgD N-terminal domain-containing protein [Paracidovorax anthurii]RAR76834.1 flagellar basal-body rod modification protein FlgD [Paracidovorax anthurii]